MDKHMRRMRAVAVSRSQSPSEAHASPEPMEPSSSEKRKPPVSRIRAGVERARERYPRHPKPLPLQPLNETQKAKMQAPVASRDDLVKQIQALDAQLELLRLKAGLPTQAEKNALQETQEHNATMDETVHNSQRLVRQLHAMASHQLQQPPANPLRTHIHLPRDKLQRCALLQALKGVKLRRAAEDGIARFRDLEDSLSYMKQERFTTDDGTHYCNRFEVIVFPQFKTARQMYDALLFWWHSLEISVTEMIDHVSVREDEEDLGPAIWNQRLIHVVPDVGCTEELNATGFAQFFDSYDLMDGGPLGIIAQDSVDVDDLYPYKPLERTRKDIQTYYLFSEYVDPVTKHKSVVMKMALFNGQLAPQFPVDPRVIAKLHENMPKWCELVNEFLCNFVVST